MKKLIVSAGLSLIVTALAAQNTQPEMVNIIKFPDGSAAYCKTLNQTGDGTYTIGGIVGTESQISISTTDYPPTTIPGRLVDISHGGSGTICIECAGSKGSCFEYTIRKLTDIQTKVAINDGLGTVVCSNTSGVMVNESGNIAGASGRGDCSLTTLPIGISFDDIVNNGTGVPNMAGLGVITGIENFGSYYCFNCMPGPGYCFWFTIANGPTTHNDLGW